MVVVRVVRVGDMVVVRVVRVEEMVVVKGVRSEKMVVMKVLVVLIVMVKIFAIEVL